MAIYNSIDLWNEFIFAYVLTSNPASRTLPLAIWDFRASTPRTSGHPLRRHAHLVAADRRLRVRPGAHRQGGMMAGALKG